MTISGIPFEAEIPFFVANNHVTYNGVVFTKEAVKKAMSQLKDIPVMLPDGRVVGIITNAQKTISWPYGEKESGLCTVKCNGYLFPCEPEIYVHEQDGSVITDFSFASVCLAGLHKEERK